MFVLKRLCDVHGAGFELLVMHIYDSWVVIDTHVSINVDQILIRS